MIAQFVERKVRAPKSIVPPNRWDSREYGKCSRK